MFCAKEEISLFFFLGLSWLWGCTVVCFVRKDISSFLGFNLLSFVFVGASVLFVTASQSCKHYNLQHVLYSSSLISGVSG